MIYMPLEMPVVAEEIINTIRLHGGSAYLVGGAVRDMLRGYEPQDLDIACSLNKEELLCIFSDGKPIGGAYGTVSVHDVEITPYRTECEYNDHRHPCTVSFDADIYSDLARRDFTVNAMAYDGSELIDIYGGEQDLLSHTLRCVGDAKVRFAEDALRILRLFRFAAVMSYNVEWDTFDAAIQLCGSIASLPPERVRREMQIIMLSDSPHVLAPLISAGGLTAFGFTCDAPCLHSLSRVSPVMLSRWWALLHFCSASAALVCAAFGFSHSLERDLNALNTLYHAHLPADRLQLKLALAHMPDMDFGEAFAAFAAINPRFVQINNIFCDICQNKEPFRIKNLAISGNDILRLGIKDKKIGDILYELLIFAIKNPSQNNYDCLIKVAKSIQSFL